MDFLIHLLGKDTWEILGNPSPRDFPRALLSADGFPILSPVLLEDGSIQTISNPMQQSNEHSFLWSPTNQHTQSMANLHRSKVATRMNAVIAAHSLTFLIAWNLRHPRPLQKQCRHQFSSLVSGQAQTNLN